MRRQHEKHHRRSTRLRGYDYSKPGAYYVTICTLDKKCYFGKIQSGNIKLTPVGSIVKQYWFEIQNHFDKVKCKLDKFVVMPNHVHGILILANTKNVGFQYIEPLRRDVASRQTNKYQRVIPRSIGSIIRCYKAAVTRWCNRMGYKYFHWQRGFYDHVIRDDRDLNRIRDYIINNPLKWHLDKCNPDY